MFSNYPRLKKIRHNMKYEESIDLTDAVAIETYENPIN